MKLFVNVVLLSLADQIPIELTGVEVGEQEEAQAACVQGALLLTAAVGQTQDRIRTKIPTSSTSIVKWTTVNEKRRTNTRLIPW